MKLSTRSTYGMRALVELALTARHRPVSVASIAKRQELSVAYLEQLLHRLRQQGVVGSIRGPRGGYVLAKDPEQITMADVIRVLDGENGETMGKGSTNGSSRVGASRAAGRAHHRHAQRIAHTVWRCVHDRVAESLGAVTLQDLCNAVRTDGEDPPDHRF